MVESLQNADLSREAREMGTVLAIVVIDFAAVAIVVVVRRVELVCVDDPDGPPFACRMRHRLHHYRERSATELVRHVIESVDACQLDRGEVSADKLVVLCCCMGEPKCDLVPVS